MYDSLSKLYVPFSPFSKILSVISGVYDNHIPLVNLLWENWKVETFEGGKLRKSCICETIFCFHSWTNVNGFLKLYSVRKLQKSIIAFLFANNFKIQIFMYYERLWQNIKFKLITQIYVRNKHMSSRLITCSKHDFSRPLINGMNRLWGQNHTDRVCGKKTHGIICNYFSPFHR